MVALFRKIGREDKEAQAILLKLEPHKALSQRMEHLKHVKHLEDVLKSFFYLEDAYIFCDYGKELVIAHRQSMYKNVGSELAWPDSDQ